MIFFAEYGRVGIMNELILNAQIENLNQVLEFVNRILEEEKCLPYVQLEIDSAVEELFVNIAHYAYAPDIGCVSIQVFVEEKDVIIIFKDNGIPYNPLARKDPDITLPLEERRIGGLGIYIVKQYMDNVDYSYENGMNVLRIKKNIYERH